MVFRNLITDAIQATEPGGRVSIVTARALRWWISVADTGSDIPADSAWRFRSGLKQLDSTITIECEIGRGTAFTLRFPARNDRAAQAAAS